MLIINETDIARLSDPIELTTVMEQAMLSYAQGDFVMPDRVHMDFDENTLLLMPASSGNYFSTKLVSLFPGNTKIGEPVLFGTVVLCSGETGKPLALFNGAKLTAVRTAAVGSCGIRHLSNPDAHSLGLVGAGVQGIHQILFAVGNRPIRKVFIYDPWAKHLNETVSYLEKQLPKVSFTIAKDPLELCKQSEIIITATNATEQVLVNDPEALQGKCIIAIGSYKPEMVEIPEAVFELLDHCYIDVDMALDESGDLIHPLSKGLLKRSQILLLSDIIKGIRNIDFTQTQLYKSVGMALFDLFAAEFLYNKAQELDIGQEVSF